MQSINLILISGYSPPEQWNTPKELFLLLKKEPHACHSHITREETTPNIITMTPVIPGKVTHTFLTTSSIVYRTTPYLWHTFWTLTSDYGQLSEMRVSTPFMHALRQWEFWCISCTWLRVDSASATYAPHTSVGALKLEHAMNLFTYFHMCVHMEIERRIEIDREPIHG